jgi:hypothetical protein
MQIVCGIIKITLMSGENNGISCVSPSHAEENVKGRALSNGTTTAVQGESRKSIDVKFKCANCKCARECSGKRREAHFIAIPLWGVAAASLSLEQLANEIYRPQ